MNAFHFLFKWNEENNDEKEKRKKNVTRPRKRNERIGNTLL